MLILAVIIGIYLFLGCIMDSLSMLLLTIPIFFPIIMGTDYWGLDPEGKAIWFGILALMVVEIGLITPPVGMNVFSSSMAKDVPMKEAVKGIVPVLMSAAFWKPNCMTWGAGQLSVVGTCFVPRADIAKYHLMSAKLLFSALRYLPM